jgi:adenylate cyclase
MQGFTDLTERLQERIEPVLNHYLAEMSRQAFERNGTIDKYIGDAMMVFWNAPLSQQDHAHIACETALALVDHEARIKPALATLGCDKCFTRIGIHTGPVIVGFFGSKERLTYTAVGDSVNLAARLEPSNKIYGTQILVSRDTMQAAGESMLFRPVDRLRVYGRKEPVGVYELVCERSRATPDQLWLAEQSEAAGRAYLSRDWDGCLRIVEKILARFPDDGPAKMWRSRIEAYRTSPPPVEWDGVWEQTSK